MDIYNITRRHCIKLATLGMGAPYFFQPTLALSHMTQSRHENDAMRIPITMCHGVSERLTIERFNKYFEIASSLGFSSINYSQVENWLSNDVAPPNKPIAFDFDHPVRSIYTDIFPIMKRYGFTGKSIYQHRTHGTNVCRRCLSTRPKGIHALGRRSKS